MGIIVVTRFLFGGPAIGPILERLARMSESHRAILIEIEVSGSKTLYLATEYLTVNSNRYEGIVTGGLYIDHKIDYIKEGDADVSVKLLNKRVSEQSTVTDKFSDIFSTYDITSKRIRLLEYIEGVAYANLPKLLKGRISHPFSYTPTEVNFDVVADKDFYIDIPPKIISEDNYPDAPDTVYGARIPWVFGECLSSTESEIDLGGGIVWPTYIQPKIGVPTFCIDEPNAYFRGWNHTIKSTQYMYEVLAGYLCRCFPSYLTMSTADSDTQCQLTWPRARELIVTPNGHTVVGATLPQNLYDENPSTVCTIHKNESVTLNLPPISDLGVVHLGVNWYPAILINIFDCSDWGELKIYWIDKDGDSELLETITSGTGVQIIGGLKVMSAVDEITDWNWGDSKIKLEFVNAATDPDFVRIEQCWMYIPFATRTRLGMSRTPKILTPGTFGKLVEEAYDVIWSRPTEDYPPFLVSCEGYSEAGVIKDHLVDVVEQIHTQILDTDRFEIDSTNFANIKTALETYYGAGYPKVSMPIAIGEDAEKFIADAAAKFGVSRITLPTGSSIWKPRISLIFHDLDVASASYGTELDVKLIKNLKVGKTDSKDIKNEITVRFDYNWGTEKYEREVYIKRDPYTGVWSSDPSDAARHGAASDAYDDFGQWSDGHKIDLKYNYHPPKPSALGRNQAISVLRRAFDFFHLPRITLEFDIFASDLLIGDTIEFASTFDTDWGKCFGVSWNGLYFRVLGLGFSSEGVHWRKVYAEACPASVS